MKNIIQRLEKKLKQKRSYLFGNRKKDWPKGPAFISFTFDDFPRSAYLRGGEVLKRYKARGTYYVSLGLMGRESPHGELFVLEDLKKSVADGHELGSHTYDHLNAWLTTPAAFKETITKNKKAFKSIFPDLELKTLSYPFTEPHPRVKSIAGEQFACCRGGGQTNNKGRIDLNLLRSCFIDKNNREDQSYFKEIVEKNSKDKGWLIFSTHDIREHPSECGCHPDLFDEIVRYSVDSGAIILPVFEVYSRVVK